MSGRILTLLLASLLATPAVQARVLVARIDKATTPVAELQGVTVRLEWNANEAHGQLSISARRVTAPDLGYRFDNVRWQCTLARDAANGWLCHGEVQSNGRNRMRLDLDLATATTDVTLARAGATLAMHRNAAVPDLTRIDLARVPVAWAQALVSQAWPAANLKSGTLSGVLEIHTPTERPLRVSGPLSVAALALDTPDGSIATEGVNARLRMDYRKHAGLSLVTLDGDLAGGEILVGSGYLSLPPQPIAVSIAAREQGTGWKIPALLWNDGNALRVEGGLGFDTDLGLEEANLHFASGDLSPLRPRYLSGWLGLLGLGELQMRGALEAQVQMQGGALTRLETRLHNIDLIDGQQRFRLEGIDGTPVYSAGVSTRSQLAWKQGELHGLAFGATVMRLEGEAGAIGLREPAVVPMLGGALRFEDINLRPPAGERGLEFDFGLAVQGLDVGQLSKALDWPAFQGTLDGRIPKARYANDRLDFDGALTTRMFDGTVQVTGLSMERPFGTAPTLSADIALDDLNLQSLTQVFGFGEITGALDGRIRNLRLVDWSAEGFDADLHTDPAWKGKQRISQRAVQDLSNVGGGGGGGGGLGNSLQAQALKLFDDFGYRRIGIRCRLAEQVCDMDGLRSAGNGFIIVEGSGLPRLSVVGYNRRVDWATLVERLVAVTQGDSKPVIE